MIQKILLGSWGILRGKTKWLLLLCLILAVPAVIGVSQLEGSNQISDYVDSGSDTYKDMKVLQDNFSDQSIIVLVKGSDVSEIVSGQNIKAFGYMNERLSEDPRLLFVMTPQFPATDGPLEDIIIDPETGGITSQFRSAFFNPQVAFMNLGMIGGVETPERHGLIAEIRDALDAAEFDSNVELVVTGFPVLQDFIAYEIPDTLNNLMGIVLIVMAIVLALTFKMLGSFVRRWLTLGLVGLSVLYTMGIMGFLDIKMTNISFTVFPILLGLGVDYIIQFHNRYDEESRKGQSADQSVRRTLSGVGRPMLMAMICCCAGFAAVTFSNNPGMQDFGATLVLGVIICGLVAINLLMGILYGLDSRNDATRKPAPRKAGPLENFFKFLTPRVVKLAPIIIILAVALSIAGWVFESDIETVVGTDGSVKDDNQELLDVNELSALSGGSLPIDTVILADNVLDPELLQWVVERSDSLMAKEAMTIDDGQEHYVGAISSLPHLFLRFGALPDSVEQAEAMLAEIPRSIWINMVNQDRTALHIQTRIMTFANEPIVQTTEAIEQEFAFPPGGATVIASSGTSLVSPILAEDLDQTRDLILYVGVGVIIAVLFLLFRFNWKRVVATAFPVILVLGWSNLFMAASDIRMSTIMALLPAQIMAIGLDSTILILLRYYEERDLGEDPMTAMTTAMTKVGRAILGSGSMIIIGFGVLLFAFEFPMLQDFGLVTMVGTLLVFICALVVQPALVVAFDLKFAKESEPDLAKSHLTPAFAKVSSEEETFNRGGTSTGNM